VASFSVLPCPTLLATCLTGLSSTRTSRYTTCVGVSSSHGFDDAVLPARLRSSAR